MSCLLSRGGGAGSGAGEVPISDVGAHTVRSDASWAMVILGPVKTLPSAASLAGGN